MYLLRYILGDEVYQVIEKCGCAGTCHKMDHMETVLDFSEVEIKDGTNTTDVRPVVRVNFLPRDLTYRYDRIIIYRWLCICANSKLTSDNALGRVQETRRKCVFWETKKSHRDAWRVCTRSNILVHPPDSKFTNTGIRGCRLIIDDANTIKHTSVWFFVYFRTRRGSKREIIQITQCACVWIK